MKVVFLDIDGVLNDRNILANARHETITIDKAEWLRSMIGQLYVDRVKKIIEQTGAKIVLSSAWRRMFKSLDEIKLFMKDIGFNPNDVIGETPNGHPPARALALGSAATYPTYRGLEIQKFISDWEGEEIDSIVILDDMKPEQFCHLAHRLIQTEGWNVGITDEDVEKAIELFNQPDNTHKQFDWNTFLGKDD